MLSNELLAECWNPKSRNKKLFKIKDFYRTFVDTLNNTLEMNLKTKLGLMLHIASIPYPSLI